MTDTFKSHVTGTTSPGEFHFSITPDDGADLPFRPRAIRVGSAGTIVMRDEGGTDVTYTVTAGERLDFRAMRVMATGTTAGDIVGWY